MNDTHHDRIDDFLRALQKALGGPSRQTEEIVEEVRTDLNAHTRRFQAEGHSEEDAVEHALGEMGDPYELAHNVRREIPPFGGDVLTTIRYVAGSGVLLWLLVLMWHFRAGSYGFSGLTGSVGVMLLHLPVILLLWPRIVWRRNWLFGLIPAGLGLVFAFFLNAGGVQSSEPLAIHIPQTEEEVAALGQLDAEQEPAPINPDSWSGFPVVILTAAGFVALVLLVAMQQRSQRQMVLFVATLAILLIEAPFQVEESLFRQDRKQVRDYLNESFKRSGTYPTTETFKSSGPKLRSRRPGVRVANEQFSLFWRRPLSSGFSIQYSSEDRRVRVQD